MFSPQRVGPSSVFIQQLIEDGKMPPPEGGVWGSNESAPVALWPDPDDGSKAEAAKAVPKERVRPLAYLAIRSLARLSVSTTISLNPLRRCFSARLHG